MYEIEVINTKTGETKFIGGTSLASAYRKAGLNPAEWDVLFMDFVDEKFTKNLLKVLHYKF